MPFVNEKISHKDWIKYNLDALHKSIYFSTEQWTVDHERNIFLVKKGEGHELGVDTHISVWLFYWRGEACRFTKEIIDYKKISEKHYASNQKITEIQIPEKYKKEK